MPGKPGTLGKRTVFVPLRVSAVEEAWIEADRGPLTRSEYLRWLIGKAHRDGGGLS